MTPLILKTCAGFVKDGFEVELWVPRRHNPDLPAGDLAKEGWNNADLLQQYGIKERFIIKRLPVIDIMRFAGPIGFILMVANFNLIVWLRLRQLRNESTILYAHDMRDVILPALSRLPAFVEIHDFYESSLGFLNRFVLKRTRGLVVTNTIKMERLANEYEFPKNRMLRQPNAVDPHVFEIAETKAEARQKLGLPADRTTALYAGHLFSWKGVDTLVRAAQFLPENIWIYFVGGTPEDRARLQNIVREEKLSRIEFLPHQPHEKIPLYLKAADVLVLPNTATQEASRVETSPVKLFEYLASGTPIVASDIPSVREIVTESEVRFARADDPKSFAEAIAAVISDPEAPERSRAGQALAHTHSWEARAQAISTFIRTHIFHA